MNSVPPNNLDQLVAWTRVFVNEVTAKLLQTERKVKELSHRLKRMENEQPK